MTTLRDTPDWLIARWTQAYGADIARAIAAANAQEPALDLTVKAGCRALGRARARPRPADRHACGPLAHGAISLLPGFTEGAWWVQDAAAALPARLLGDLRDRRVADLCAAPGGKTAQLAHAGARVTAVDRSPRAARAAARQSRAARRLRPRSSPPTCSNGRPSRSTPCCSTRPARRPAPSAAIPTCPGSRAKPTSRALTAMQHSAARPRVDLIKPGGTLIYCVCSLEPEEGERQVDGLLARDPRVDACADRAGRNRSAIRSSISAAGDLAHAAAASAGPDPRWGGLDGFFAARLKPDLTAFPRTAGAILELRAALRYLADRRANRPRRGDKAP